MVKWVTSAFLAGLLFAGVFPYDLSSLGLYPANFHPARSFSRQFSSPLGIFHYYSFPVGFFIAVFQTRISTDDIFLEAGIGCVSFVLVWLGSVRIGNNFFG